VGKGVTLTEEELKKSKVLLGEMETFLSLKGDF